MRPILLFILTLLFGFSYGQHFAYPSIIPSGQKLSAFVPVGWKILDSAKGDLNKDGIKDAVIILQYRDSVTLVKSEEDTVLTQPRILLILFKNYSDNNFHVTEQTNTFILSHNNATMDDPYQGLTIDKGILKFDFHLFYNMGSWYTTSATYKFRYDGKEFLLIGADLSTIHRATLDYEDYSYNFLTKKRSYTKGNETKGTKETNSKLLNILLLKTLKTFIEPFSWEIESDIYL